MTERLSKFILTLVLAPILSVLLLLLAALMCLLPLLAIIHPSSITINRKDREQS